MRSRASRRASWSAGWAISIPKPWPTNRIGAGHAEGLFEAWANLYARFAVAMDAADRGQAERLASLRYPDIRAEVEGVRWVENCVRSADQGGVWVDYE